MALYGPDIPLARNLVDQGKRKEIFDIIAPYTMSCDDIEIFKAAPQRLQDLWLESFTASLKGMLLTGLQKLTKLEFSKCFPAHGGFPAPTQAASIGLEPGQSILHR